MNTTMNTTTRSNQTVDLAQFLSYAAALIRSQGYVSGTTAKETGKDSTGTLAWTWATQGRVGEILQGIKFENYDRATGAATLEWMKNCKPYGEYMHNIFRIGGQTTLSQRDAGYAASAVHIYEKDRQKELNPTGNYLGEMGKRISLRLTLKNIRSFDSAYGWCYAYNFVDAQENIVVWTTGKPPEELRLELEKTFLVTGTVKKYTTWKGQRQTELNRCTLKP